MVAAVEFTVVAAMVFYRGGSVGILRWWQQCNLTWWQRWYFNVWQRWYFNMLAGGILMWGQWWYFNVVTAVVF